jgi:hypothetical protein
MLSSSAVSDPVVVGRLCGVAVADASPGSAGPYNDGNVVVQLVGVYTNNPDGELGTRHSMRSYSLRSAKN